MMIQGILAILRLCIPAVLVLACLAGERATGSGPVQRRPNILLVISDDQSWPHAGAYGDIFESYPYFGRMQPGIGGFRERGQYNPRFLPPRQPEHYPRR